MVKDFEQDKIVAFHVAQIEDFVKIIMLILKIQYNFSVQFLSKVILAYILKIILFEI